MSGSPHLAGRMPILTAEEMAAADHAAIAAGTPQEVLMQRAGAAVASYIQKHYSPRDCVVACGAGHNGGDGRIAAKLLADAGWKTQIITPDKNIALPPCGLVIDALLGTGLNKPVAGNYATLIHQINEVGCPVIAVDIASGIDASTGEVMGVAVRADHTVAFASAKYGHVLLPGKAYTGVLHVADIGIAIPLASGLLNTPAGWVLPAPNLESHKYSRGAALVMGGEITCTGAAKLAAGAALKIGAGAVSVICNEQTLPIYAASFTAVMTKLVKNNTAFDALVNHPNITSLAIGCGAGANEGTIRHAITMLETGKPCVVDADALHPEIIPHLHEKSVITPHQGECKRMFGTFKHKMEVAREITSKIPGVVVLKGNDTVIAQQGKTLVVNNHAPPTLATAGSGDVLTGFITGLLAQGMAPFDAACAAVWMHGEAGYNAGQFFTAEDLIASL